MSRDLPRAAWEGDREAVEGASGWRSTVNCEPCLALRRLAPSVTS
jgi:hypothetical protein